jgi:hypothetical protein
MGAVERLPIPTWVTYAAAILLIEALAIWSDRFLDPSQLPVPTAYTAIVVFFPLALIHHLDGVARKALQRFRPALSMSAEEVEGLSYELTTMPRGPSWIATLLGTVVVLLGVTESPEEILGPPSMPVPFSIIGFGAFLFTFVSLALLFYHTIRQLRLVSTIHSRAVTIDLLQPQPVHAFSVLTMRTGVALVLLSYYILAVSAGVRLSPLTVGLLGINLSLALGLFTWPLYGMHRRLVEKKERLLHAVVDRIENTFSSLHEALERREAGQIDALNKGLSGLIVERDMIARAPTWPWAPGTVRVFGGSVLLPIALLLLSRVVERWIGP